MALYSGGTTTNTRTALGLIAGAGAVLAGAAFLNNEMAKRAERRHPPKGKFIEADGVRLHYLDRGAGSPVVLLHGNSVMADDYAISGVLDLVAKNHRVIVFDRPGFGYSARPRSTVWTPKAQAALLQKALRQLGIDRSVVVGHSWGTMVAMAMALDSPVAVSALVLMSGYYFPTPRVDVPGAALPAVPIVGDVLRYTVSPLTARLLGPAIFKKTFAPAPVPRRFSQEFPMDLVVRPSQIRAEAAEAALMIPGASVMVNRHADLSMPVTVVAGAQDKIVSTAHQSVRLHDRIGQSRIRTFPGVGHMVHHTRPQQVADVIQEAASAASLHQIPSAKVA